MKLAVAIGLSAPKVQVGRAGSTPFLEIEIYDRVVRPDGSVERLHQEDFCQAMGIAPEMKYQAEGGTGFKKCFELLRRVSSLPAVDLLRIFDAVVFNFLVGNCDAHGKNFSLLYRGREVRLAPLYDLVCTQAYPELSKEMAMKLGDERDLSRIGTKNWRRFADETGFGQPIALRRLRALAQQVLGAVHTLAPRYETATNAPAIVRANCERLLGKS